MWIDRVKEAKKRLGMSSREIAAATEGKLSERDVIRLLGGEYKKPFVDDVIALGAALRLSPHELFGETHTVVENEKTVVDAADLQAQITSLKAEIECLKREIEHKDKLIEMKDELLEAKSELLESYRPPRAITFH